MIWSGLVLSWRQHFPVTYSMLRPWWHFFDLLEFVKFINFRFCLHFSFDNLVRLLCSSTTSPALWQTEFQWRHMEKQHPRETHCKHDHIAVKNLYYCPKRCKKLNEIISKFFTWNHSVIKLILVHLILSICRLCVYIASCELPPMMMSHETHE